jgi:hypothetical protein
MRVSSIQIISFGSAILTSICAPPPLFHGAHLEEAKAPGSSIFYWFRLTGGGLELQSALNPLKTFSPCSLPYYGISSIVILSFHCQYLYIGPSLNDQ